MMNSKILFLLFASLLSAGNLSSQELLQSASDDFKDAQVLIGNAEREYMHYRSFSDNSYSSAAEKSPDKQGFTFDWVKPSIWMSYNHYDPNEGNDGAAWQGRGLNTWGYAGARAEWNGLSVVLAPQFWFAQNLSFPLMPASSSHDSEYAYYTANIDLPQRFGDDPIYSLDWGQSELRYTYNNRWTIGFGTQNIWLGPAQHNPILLSNNAPGFPKIDVGLLPTETAIGDVEFRMVWGQLHESDYFDADASNDTNFFNSIHIAFSPELVSGFTFGLNRIAISDWNYVDYTNPLFLFDPRMKTDFGSDATDQRASITFDWIFPEVGFEVYGEWGINDYSASMGNIMRAPQHSHAYTIGGRQAIFPFNSKNSFVIISSELSNLIHSRDYEIGLGMGQTGFYTHHIVKQGHTNNGQLLGPYIGPGADSQFFSADYYWSDGRVGLFFERNHVNKDYIYGDPNREPGDILRVFVKVKTGLNAYYRFDSFLIGTKAYYLRLENYNWIEDNDINSYYLSLYFSL